MIRFTHAHSAVLSIASITSAGFFCNKTVALSFVRAVVKKKSLQRVTNSPVSFHFVPLVRDIANFLALRASGFSQKTNINRYHIFKRTLSRRRSSRELYIPKLFLRAGKQSEGIEIKYLKAAIRSETTTRMSHGRPGPYFYCPVKCERTRKCRQIAGARVVFRVTHRTD